MILPLNDSIPSIHKPYAAWGVIIATAAAFLLQKSGSDKEFAESILALGLTPKTALEQPEHFFTYMLLHGGWWHAISNLWLFRIFADNVEDVMGPWRFLAFYVICGIIAGGTHCLVYPDSAVPVVGASGAISGVLGAYFLLYPHARVTTLVFFIILRLPAAVYLGGWFVLQLVSAVTERSAGIAWWAHLGGFLAGLALLPLFQKKQACARRFATSLSPSPS